MMETPLNAWLLFDHSPRHAPEAELVSRTPSGEMERSTYAEFGRRTQQLMHALDHLGLAPGDRVATLAWNSARHLEAYFGVPCTGRVLHTLNVRVSPEELAFMLEDADDRAVLVDPDLLPHFEQALALGPSPAHIIVLGDRGARHVAVRRHRLRGPPGRRADRLPAPRHRRAHAHGALLHVGDHRTAQGRRLHPSLHLPPRPGRHLPRRHVDRTGRCRAAAGADVPRQRLGHALRGGRRRGQAGLLRRCPRSVGLRRPAGGRAGHGERRRSHGVARHRRRAGPPGRDVARAPPHHLRRGAAAPRPDRALRTEFGIPWCRRGG